MKQIWTNEFGYELNGFSFKVIAHDAFVSCDRLGTPAAAQFMKFL